jgi:hypothetical protein
MKTIMITLLTSLPLLGACNPFVKPADEVSDSRLESLRLPDGFELSVIADPIENARSMVLGDAGTLFVGSRHAGKVYAVLYD